MANDRCWGVCTIVSTGQDASTHLMSAVNSMCYIVHRHIYGHVEPDICRGLPQCLGGKQCVLLTRLIASFIIFGTTEVPMEAVKRHSLTCKFLWIALLYIFKSVYPKLYWLFYLTYSDIATVMRVHICSNNSQWPAFCCMRESSLATK